MGKQVDKLIPLTPPGEHLKEFMSDFGITQYRLAKELRIQQTRISQILKGQRAITADTALRLGRFFGTSSKLWLNLQQNYDLERAERDKGEEIAQTVTPISENSEFAAAR